MRIISQPARSALAALGVVIIVTAGACASERPARVTLGAESGSPSEPGDGVPASVREILEKGGMVFEDGRFDTDMSAEETLDKFWELYPRETFADKDPDVYPVSITSAVQTVLPGRDTLMVHIAGVEVRPEGVAPLEGDENSNPEPLTGNMFGFFDAETGEFLVAVTGAPAEQ